MRALVVYESIFGSTKAIAVAVADGLAGEAQRARRWAVQLGLTVTTMPVS